MPSGQLLNSIILKGLEVHLCHLTLNQRKDIVALIEDSRSLFCDIPSQTTVLQYNINVDDAQPIKQHPYRLSPKKRELIVNWCFFFKCEPKSSQLKEQKTSTTSVCVH